MRPIFNIFFLCFTDPAFPWGRQRLPDRQFRSHRGQETSKKLPFPAKNTGWKWKSSQEWKCIALTRPIWAGWDGGPDRLSGSTSSILTSAAECAAWGQIPSFFPLNLFCVLFFFFLFNPLSHTGTHGKWLVAAITDKKRCWGLRKLYLYWSQAWGFPLGKQKHSQ